MNTGFVISKFHKSISEYYSYYCNPPPQKNYRNYSSVSQAWYDRHERARERSQIGATPEKTTKEPAPEARLKFISCKFKKWCGRGCAYACESNPEIFTGSEEEEEDGDYKNEYLRVAKLLAHEDNEREKLEEEEINLQEDSPSVEETP